MNMLKENDLLINIFNRILNEGLFDNVLENIPSISGTSTYKSLVIKKNNLILKIMLKILKESPKGVFDKFIKQSGIVLKEEEENILNKIEGYLNDAKKILNNGQIDIANKSFEFLKLSAKVKNEIENYVPVNPVLQFFLQSYKNGELDGILEEILNDEKNFEIIKGTAFAFAEENINLDKLYEFINKSILSNDDKIDMTREIVNNKLNSKAKKSDMFSWMVGNLDNISKNIFDESIFGNQISDFFKDVLKEINKILGLSSENMSVINKFLRNLDINSSKYKSYAALEKMTKDAVAGKKPNKQEAEEVKEQIKKDIAEADKSVWEKIKDYFSSEESADESEESELNKKIKNAKNMSYD